MDTKLKKYKKSIYVAVFVVCIVSFLLTVVSVTGASLLNSYTGYLDYDFFQNNGYDTFSAFLESEADSIQTLSQRLQEHMEDWLLAAIIAGGICLISLIYLVVVTGEKDGSGKIRLTRFDKVFAEIQMFGILFLFFAGGPIFVHTENLVVESFYGLEQGISASTMTLNFGVLVLVGGGAASLGLGLLLSCIKKIKAGRFLEQSLCGLIIHRLYADIYKGGSTMRKVTLIALLVCLLSATMFLAPVIFIVILVFAPKWVRRYDEIRKGLKEVNGGNLDYKIPVEGDDELGRLAEEINQITEATSIAVQNEVKNQRMKTDLISNVSHDLKTPLTSMVTYIDLLKTEGLTSEHAPGYLKVLEQKTERLRQLTEDLFEAAKASSGAIPVRMSRVDLLSLLNQALGEMNERVEQSNLEFVVNAEKERYFVNADGQLLWRVISNLLNNVLKYSQPHTRVYIDFMRTDEIGRAQVFMEMKNISSQSLNIEPSELMERFKRGDEARATEGSGLGLAIAKDLMKLMNGQIEIKIDGDLFKVKIELEAASEDAPIVTPMDFGDIGSAAGSEDVLSMDDLPGGEAYEWNHEEQAARENAENPEDAESMEAMAGVETVKDIGSTDDPDDRDRTAQEGIQEKERERMDCEAAGLCLDGTPAPTADDPQTPLKEESHVKEKAHPARCVQVRHRKPNLENNQQKAFKHRKVRS